jgi:1,4-alpha-glucan branching enzyme
MQKIKKEKMSFSLEDVNAKEVYLVGEFNNWKQDAHPMKNNGKGKWAKQVLLSEGTFEYKFLVDNQWMVDPKNKRTCPNCFGTQNSIVSVSK